VRVITASSCTAIPSSRGQPGRCAGAQGPTAETDAANRLLAAIGWLAKQKPGIYDGLDVPYTRHCTGNEAQRWATD